MTRPIAAWLIAPLASLLLGGSARADLGYTLTDLGSVMIYGVNNSGQVVGTHGTPDGLRVFLTGPGGGPKANLPTLGGFFMTSGGVNDLGQVAGVGLTAQDHLNAYLSGPNGGALSDLGAGLNDVYGVNGSGQIAGNGYTSSYATHAFLMDPNGSLRDLGTIGGGNYTNARGINASGQVTGFGFTSQGETHAFLSGPNGGPLTDLGTLAGAYQSFGMAVNAAGQVAGFSLTTAGWRAFLSGPNGGPLASLGTLAGGNNTWAYGVNASGQVVGTGDNGTGYDQAFVSGANGGPLINLNTLVNSPDFRLGTAMWISDTGYIAGYMYDGNNSQHAFLLTPDVAAVPEPSSLAITLGCGLLGLGGWAVRRRAIAIV